MKREPASVYLIEKLKPNDKPYKARRFGGFCDDTGPQASQRHLWHERAVEFREVVKDE